MSTDTDPVAARLAEIRENHAEAEASRALFDLGDRADAFRASVMDIPALLGALEAVLALADEWRQKGLALGAQIAAEDAGAVRAGFMMCTAQAYENCANATRMAISAALTGTETTDG